MKLRFEPALVQELVLAETLRDLGFRELVRSRMEPVYERPLEERARKFGQLYEGLFEERGLGVVVAEELARFPLLSRLEQVLVFRAERGGEEEAELSRDRRLAGIRLRPARFSRPEQLRPLLRHEFMHLSDMMDDCFGYQPQALGENPAQEHLNRRRYSLLWDVYIDGRLERQGLEGEASRQERQGEWERTLSFLPRQARREGFSGLWQGEKVTHSQLIAFAQEPTLLIGDGGGEEGVGIAPIPGAPCPLCRFPTYAWGDPLPVAHRIRADFPAWEPNDGACLRCVELYQIQAGVW